MSSKEERVFGVCIYTGLNVRTCLLSYTYTLALLDIDPLRAEVKRKKEKGRIETFLLPLFFFSSLSLSLSLFPRSGICSFEKNTRQAESDGSRAERERWLEVAQLKVILPKKSVWLCACVCVNCLVTICHLPGVTP